MKPNALDWIAWILLIIGGLNWGLVGFFNFDLVVFLLGFSGLLVRVVYAIVGVAALYSIITMSKYH